MGSQASRTATSEAAGLILTAPGEEGAGRLQQWSDGASNAYQTSWIWKITRQGTARFIGWRTRSVPALRQVFKTYKIVFTLRFPTAYSVDP